MEPSAHYSAASSFDGPVHSEHASDSAALIAIKFRSPTPQSSPLHSHSIAQSHSLSHSHAHSHSHSHLLPTYTHFPHIHSTGIGTGLLPNSRSRSNSIILSSSSTVDRVVGAVRSILASPATLPTEPVAESTDEDEDLTEVESLLGESHVHSLASASKRRPRRSHWLRSLLAAVSSPSASSLVADVRAWFKELSSDTREKLLFLIASMLGTVLFVFLFEALLTMTAYDLESSQASFIVSYIGAYAISIAWQHGLYRILVHHSSPWCLALLHTYLSYSLSLALMTSLGYIAINMLRLSARLVALVLMPLSALTNYYLIRACVNSANDTELHDMPSATSNAFGAALNPQIHAFHLPVTVAAPMPMALGSTALSHTHATHVSSRTSHTAV